MLAISGSIDGVSDKGEARENHVVQFYDPFSKHLARLKVQTKTAGVLCCWFVAVLCCRFGAGVLC